MRKTILFLLFALLTSGAWAQIHTGLDLCLRDDASGEWLISLFDTCAVYDCDVWTYERASKGRYTLRLGDRRVDVRLRKVGIDIDHRRYKTTELTTRTLPDYPTGDSTSFRDNGYTGGEATVRGLMIDRHEVGDARFVLNELLSAIGQQFLEVEPDASGRFEVKLPLTNTSHVLLAPYGHLMLTPGETYFLLLDNRRRRHYIMGPDARLCNEMWAHPAGGTLIDMDLYAERTDDDLLAYATARLDSTERSVEQTLREHPTLSERYRQWRRGCERASWGETLVQRYFTREDVRQRQGNRLWQTLRDSVIFRLPRPYTVVQLSLPYLLNIYAKGLTERFNVGYGFDVINESIEAIEAHAREGRSLCSEAMLDTLRTLRRAGHDFEAQSRQAQGHKPEGHLFERLINQPEVKTLLMPVLMEEVYPRRAVRDVEGVDTLPLPDDLRDLYRAQLIGTELTTNRTPLTSALEAAVHRLVRSPYYRDRLLTMSRHYAELIRQSEAEQQASLMSNEPLAGLTDGQEILRRILAPLKGRVVYLDVWGTWCSPCKYNLQHLTHPLHEALDSLPVTFLYLCNNSSDASWRSVIAEYQLVGSNSLHYNLPAAQEAAVEQYLGIDKYPTYLLFDPQGHRVPGPEPRPHDIEGLKKKIEGIIGEE